MTLHTSTQSLTIVGAGLVGSTLALALARNNPGLQVQLIDTSPLLSLQPVQANSFDRRVVALNRFASDLLTELDVWQSVLDLRACAYTDMVVWDGEGTASINFSAADIYEPCLGHIVENSVVLRCLHSAIAGVQNIHFIQTAITGLRECAEGWQVQTESAQNLSPGLVIGADGAHSLVRSLAGFQVRDWPYGQTAIVTTVKTEHSHQNTAWQRFTDDGPLAFLPLEHESKNYCSIVWSAAQPEAERLLALPDDEFCLALGRAFEHRLGQIEWADERVAIELKQRHVTRYFKRGVALVGDAAHTIHPLAGQGVNLGLRDAHVLAEELSRALTRNIPLLDESPLRRFERRVQTYNLMAMGVMETFKHTFTPASPWLRVARNFGIRSVNNARGLKRQLVQMALGHAP